MKNVVCLRHPHYHGNNPPVLSCKPCCAIYIDFIKQAQQQHQLAPEDWIQSKKKVKRDSAKAGSEKS